MDLMEMSNKSIKILGAGISGLTVAYELLKKDFPVEIFEALPNPGGLAGSVKFFGHNVDLGPHIYHTPDEKIIDYWEREFGDCFHKCSHYAANLINGKLFSYPISVEMISQLGKGLSEQIFSELDEIERERSDVESRDVCSSYDKYVKSIAGPTLQALFFKKYPEKLWGLSTDDLDANWAPKRIAIRERISAFYEGQWAAVGKNGSATIVDSLLSKISALGGLINFSSPCTEIRCASGRIEELCFGDRRIIVGPDDIVINTLPVDVFTKLCGIETKLTYRGVALVYVAVNRPIHLPGKYDFLYVEDEDIAFTRVSDQSSFLAKRLEASNIFCFEVPYSDGDQISCSGDRELINLVCGGARRLSLFDSADIIDSLVLKLPRVYPMYKIGYRAELQRTQGFLDGIYNCYTTGSLANFAYADLQILFSKSIDLAARISRASLSKPLVKQRRVKPQDYTFSFGDKKIGIASPVLIIAEIGLNHCGSLVIGKRLIDGAVAAGADAVKFQTYSSHARSAPNSVVSTFAEKVNGVEETDFEMFEKFRLSTSETRELFEYSRNKGILAFSTPFDVSSVEQLELLKCPLYKVASSDLTNLQLLRRLGETGKPVILSTGMADVNELSLAVRTIQGAGGSSLAILHCTSAYPAPPESLNIRAIKTISKNFPGFLIGYSDHSTGDIYSCLAVALGARIIEKHITIDRNMEGPDHQTSLDLMEFGAFVKQLRNTELALGDGIKAPQPLEYTTMQRFKKTIYLSKDIRKGDRITRDCLVYMGPAYGIEAVHEDLVLSMVAREDLYASEPLVWEKLEFSGR
jgi:sialic acid synthase SpsE/protoporphyrinogen oxidase